MTIATEPISELVKRTSGHDSIARSASWREPVRAVGALFAVLLLASCSKPQDADPWRHFLFARFDTAKEHENGLSSLRKTNPKEYLTAIRIERGDDAWLSELAQLQPADYQAEMAKRSAEAERKQAADAAIAMQGTDCIVTFAQFQSLRSGLSYSTVQKILGCNGVEMSRVDMNGFDDVMYSWKGGLIANMTAMFQNNRLISKAQYGLR